MMPESRLQVRVQPGASKTEVVGLEHGVLRVRVSAAPERGKATEAAIALIARHLGVPKRDVSLVSGGATRRKLLSISGMDAQESLRRLGETGA